MRGRVVVALVLAVLVLGAFAGGAQARDATVRSFDQTAISMHFFPATGKKAPTVLIGPGWSMSGETDENSTSDELFGGVGVGALRQAGFNVLTWDPRGFGKSGGAVEVDSPDYEARDVSALIDWLAKQPEAQLDKAGDPRVGMNGSSYGGGIQWVTAARDARVDVITPNISWNSLTTSLYKDGALKSGWGLVLCGSGIAASLPGGLLNPDGPEPSRLDPHVLNTCVSGIATGVMSPADQAWYAAHGPDTCCPRSRSPR